MKKLVILSIAAAALLLTSCSQSGSVDSMLQNADTRQKVFSTIVNDHELMTEFMNSMMGSEHAMMMMKGNHDMMGKMMEGGGMMNMMKDHPEMMHNMMSDMMKDGKMMGHMMQMMNQEGMMSKECMQSCMNMMAQKGMDMSGMMQGEGMMKDGMHESHHPNN